MNRKRKIALYLVCDFLAAALAWTLFFMFRNIYINRIAYGYSLPFEFTSEYYFGLFLIPGFWIMLYYIKGFYRYVYRKSRLQDLTKTFETSLIGVIVLFFVFILDETIYSYQGYYLSISVLFISHFSLTLIPKLMITSRTVKLIRQGKIYFKTLIVGSGPKALEMYREITSKKRSEGNYFVGYVTVSNDTRDLLRDYLPCLGNYEDLVDICRRHSIEETIVAIETNEHDEVRKIINILEKINIQIKVIPNMYDILMGTANMANIYGIPLIRISHDLMPAWEENLKRLLDIVISLLAVILLSPLLLFLAIGVRLSSPGPVIYAHERIGRYGRPFTMYKFRSMYKNAEEYGPKLSTEGDPRITPFGNFMRKSRLDELPQFFNVILGDMSLVGPRPERQYYINQIVEKAPHYYHLQKVRPGITSWGQVKYGYAENAEEMIERLKYDIIYVENMSIYTDIKIIIYTLKIIFKGDGK